MKILSEDYRYSTWLWEPGDFMATFAEANNIDRVFIEFNEDNKPTTYSNILKLIPNIYFEALVSDNRWLKSDKVTPKFLLDNYSKYNFSALHIDLEFWVGPDKAENKVHAKKLIQLIMEFKNKLKCKINIDLPLWFRNEYREEYEVIQPLVDEITYMAYFTSEVPINTLLSELKNYQTKPFTLAYELAELKDSPSSSFHGKGILPMLNMHYQVREKNIYTFKGLMNPNLAIHHFKTLSNYIKLK